MCAPPNLRSSGPFGSGAHRQKDREARRPILPVFNFPGLIFYFRVACLIILPHDDHVIISLALHQERGRQPRGSLHNVVCSARLRAATLPHYVRNKKPMPRTITNKEKNNCGTPK
jgi:hypothetical protein